MLYSAVIGEADPCFRALGEVVSMTTVTASQRLSAACAVVMLVAGAAIVRSEGEASTAVVKGTLADGTVYTLAKPEHWNGTVFVDLDSLGMNADYSAWLY